MPSHLSVACILLSRGFVTDVDDVDDAVNLFSHRNPWEMFFVNEVKNISQWEERLCILVQLARYNSLLYDRITPGFVSCNFSNSFASCVIYD